MTMPKREPQFSTQPSSWSSEDRLTQLYVLPLVKGKPQPKRGKFDSTAEYYAAEYGAEIEAAGPSITFLAAAIDQDVAQARQARPARRGRPAGSGKTMTVAELATKLLPEFQRLRKAGQRLTRKQAAQVVAESERQLFRWVTEDAGQSWDAFLDYMERIAR